MKNIAKNQEKFWSYFLGGLLPLAVILAPSYQSNLAEHMFTKSFVLQIVISIAVVVHLFANKKQTFSSHPLAIVLYLTLILGFLSIFWSDNPGFAVTQFLKWVTGILLAFLVFQIQQKENQRRILQLFFLGAVVMAIIGIIQYLFNVDIVKQAAKPASTFANKNMAAQIAVLTWPLGVYLFLSHEKTSNNKVWLGVNSIGVALLLTFIFYTQTQAAWFSTIGQIILFSLVLIVYKIRSHSFIAIQDTHKLFLIIATVVLFTLINLNSGGVKPFWEKIQQGADKVVTRATNVEGEQSTIRYQIWGNALKIAKSEPVTGVGLGNYYHHAPDFGNARTHTTRSTHNDYLQLIAELGYGSSILIVLNWIFLGYLFFKILFTRLGNRFRDLILVIAVGGMAITSAFSFPLQLQTPILLISSYIALILSNERKMLISHLSHKILTAISVILLLAILVLNVSWYSKLSEFNHKIQTNDWKQPINLDLGDYVNHPMFKWFSQRVSKEYMHVKPGSSYQVAESYLALTPTDVVLLNNKIYSLIQLKQYDKAKILINNVREHEPEGYYRSYYNELILLTELRQPKELSDVLNVLDKEDVDLISMKPQTLDNMAVAAYNLQQKDRAINYLKKNLEVHPTHRDSYNKIIRMLNGVGDKESAEHYTKQLAEVEAQRN